ncbi:MAG: hypothetical protein RIK87_12850 [Fuerstiella sp.]
MKRFHSRIESLSRIRQQAEKLARLTAAVRQGEKLKADRRVDQLEQQIAELQQLGTGHLANGDATMIQSVIHAVARTAADCRTAREQQATAGDRLLKAIQEVTAARSQLQVVEKHREKELAEHRREQLIRDENMRQENNGQRYARREAVRTSGEFQDSPEPGLPPDTTSRPNTPADGETRR